MSVEKIVRPFQAGEVFNARVLAPQQPALEPNTDEASIEWKGSADSKYQEEPAPITMGFTAEFVEDKSQRQTERIKISNPDDPSQFVEIERIKKAVFKNNLSGEQTTYKFGDYNPLGG